MDKSIQRRMDFIVGFRSKNSLAKERPEFGMLTKKSKFQA